MAHEHPITSLNTRYTHIKVIPSAGKWVIIVNSIDEAVESKM